MVFSPRSTLDPLQQELLNAFFDKEERFFLTGGGALAGFHLGHRKTRDLDLFTVEEVLGEGISTLRRIVGDLVLEQAPQHADKVRFGKIRVDPPEEILANKLCTLLSRAELRDLVDVRALEQAGYQVEDALEPASRKDAGLTPGQLAWVLSEIEIGSDAQPPGVTAPELQAYLDDLVERLTDHAFPSDDSTQ